MNHPQAHKPGVPKLLPVLIVAILAGMYYFAGYVDISTPERTVQSFYKAYFDKDYETVADHLSVFWAANILPQYQNLSPAELLEKRDAIVTETGTALRNMEENQPPQPGLSIEVLKEYSKTGEYSALIIYQVMEQEQPIQKEVAFLIKEAAGYKIISFSPIEDSDLESINEYNLDQLDASFKILLGVH